MLFREVILERERLEILEQSFLEEGDDFRRIQQGQAAEDGEGNLLDLRNGVIHTKKKLPQVIGGVEVLIEVLIQRGEHRLPDLLLGVADGNIHEFVEDFVHDILGDHLLAHALALFYV